MANFLSKRLYGNSYSLLLVAILILLKGSEALVSLRGTKKADPNSASTLVQPSDDPIYIFFKIFLQELLDKTFLSAILLSFIYSPSFANLSYAAGSLISCLIAATAGKVIDVFPNLLLNILSAFCFFAFGFHSFIYVYELKNEEIKEEDYYSLPPSLDEIDEEEDEIEIKADISDKLTKLQPQGYGTLEKTSTFITPSVSEIDPDPSQVKAPVKIEKEKETKKNPKAEAETEAEKKNFADKMVGKAKDKAKKKFDKTVEARNRKEAERQSEGFFQTLFSLKFLRSKKNKFLFCVLLFTLADFVDDSFGTIVELRERNTLLKVMAVCAVVYLCTGLIVVFIGYLVKKKLFSKWRRTPENIRTVKSLGCGALIMLSFIEIFD